jgi:small conductance mechanosensitive channel
MENFNLESINFQMFTDFALTYGLRIVGAVIVFIIGWRIIAAISRSVSRLMVKRDVDPGLQSFLKSLLVNLLRILLIISVLGMLGVEMTSFIAILGAAGLAVGLALSGTLQNFAGGVMILLFKPFKVGDYLEAQGFAGTVREIQIFNTILKTPDNKTVIIPNGGLATGSMVNFSTEPIRRVDWAFGIAYGDDSDKAKQVLLDLIKSDERVLAEPEPFVAVSSLGDSSVNFTARAWVNTANFWAVFFDMNQKVYKAFPQKGLNIPFPQMDVHLYQKK